MKVMYRYVGGGAYLMGVPARDLDAEDVKQIKENVGVGEAELEASGLYKRVRRRDSSTSLGMTEEETDGTEGVS